VTVCGDEVVHPKPAPDPYRRAAELLGFTSSQCLAIEDSITGTAAAEAAGCPVVVVPNDVDVPGGPHRRHVSSLSELDVDDLRSIFASLSGERGQQTA
jgi:beta-phosphoglucomutase-like phosphatase (HAD superfamily)